MIEWVIILAVCFFIAVLFYKQANESFEIIQLEATRIDELPTIYSEHSPIVLKNFAVPSLGNQYELEKRHQIMNMAVLKGLSLKALLNSEGSLREYTWKKETAEFLAKESGLHTWFQHHLYKHLLPSPFTKWLFSFQTSLYPHHRGLFKTTAFQTVLMPTQGTAIVSIMLPKSEPYFPVNWKGRRFETLTNADTPLLAQIQYIDVKLRKGNLLVLPAHFIINIKSDDDCAWVFCAEVHHLISRIAS